MHREIVTFFTFLLSVQVYARLNWATLDEINYHDNDRLQGMIYGEFEPDPNDPDDIFDPDTNSTISLLDSAMDSIDEEKQAWAGSDPDDQGAPTWNYIRGTPLLMEAMVEYMRVLMKDAFSVEPTTSCNSILTPAEIVVDQNLGFAPNHVLLNSTEVDILMPLPSCSIPITPFGDDEPPPAFRFNKTSYRDFLFQLRDMLECSFLTFQHTAYGKMVGCLEDYYYGQANSGAEISYFDIAAEISDFEDLINQFNADLSQYPADLFNPTLVDWEDYQTYSDQTEFYADLARGARYVVISFYNTLTRHYIRLKNVQSCRDAELAQAQANQGGSTPQTWCNYVTCYKDTHNFTLLCNTLTSPNPLATASSSGQICETSTCDSPGTFPDPFYCDTTRKCPNGWFCSMIDRHCYINEQAPTFKRSYNTTVCGYPRRLADASVISGTVTEAFNSSTNHSIFSFATYWPQNCTEQEELILDPSVPEYVGPLDITQVCFQYNGTFYNNVTEETDCSILGNVTLCYTYTYANYTDGFPGPPGVGTLCLTRNSVGSEVWQVPFCEPDGPEPVFFEDAANYTDPDPYMTCSGDPSCIAQNSTHVCFNHVEDIIRIFNHFISSTGIVCEDQRMYNSPTNNTNDYVDPNASSFPPAPYATPPGYTGLGYFNVPPSIYRNLTEGSASVVGGSIPSSLEPDESAYFYGFYTLLNSDLRIYELTGLFTFTLLNNIPCGVACDFHNVTVTGNDYFLDLTGLVTPCEVPGLSVNNITGEVLYNPITDAHPNPRFNDPNECYFLEVSVLATVPMTKSPPVYAQTFKNYWTSGVIPAEPVPPWGFGGNTCRPIFLRKILYVRSPDWFTKGVTDFEQGEEDGDLRYICDSSLFMDASCSRVGAPINLNDFRSMTENVDPPSSGNDYNFLFA